MRKYLKGVPKEITKKMVQSRLKKDYIRPSFMDVIAMQALVMSMRPACLFYSVGAVIFRNNQVLSFGYNGPSQGDVHCTKVGCARIIKGELKKGGGLCRGSHAELNSIGNAARNGVSIEGASMIITIRPCNVCAKQIVNQGIRKVYFISGYDNDEDVGKYFRRLGVKLIHYESKFLNNWMKKFEGGE